MSGAPDPVAEAIRAKLNDADKPFTLVVTLRAKSKEAGDRIEAIFVTAAPAVRNEPGCLVYEQSRSATDPALFVLYDRWASVQAVIDHHKAATFQHVIAEVLGLIDGQPDIQAFVPITEGG